MRTKTTKKLGNDGYKEKASDKMVKIEINHMLANSFKSVDTGKESFLTLESPAMLTTNCLIKAGINKNKIEIPNHTDSYFEIAKKHKNTYNMTVGDYLKMLGIENIKGNLGGVWLDYMGTIHGNSEMNPKEDLKTLFEEGLLADISMLAYTFSYHSAKKVDHTHQDIYEMEKYVDELAHKFGYSKIREKVGKVYQGMFFHMFKIIRNKPQKIEQIKIPKEIYLQKYNNPLIDNGKNTLKVVQLKMEDKILHLWNSKSYSIDGMSKKLKREDNVDIGPLSIRKFLKAKGLI